MPIGGLRHRVAIEAPVEVPVPGGGVTTSWTETAKVWARIVTLSGGEGFHALQLNPELTHKVTIRYRRGLTSSHRLRFGTRMFHQYS